MDNWTYAGRKLSDGENSSQYHELHISLVKAQLLSLHCIRHFYARAISGTHWISSGGVDHSVGPEKWTRLSPGLSLIEGEGVLRFSPVDARPHTQKKGRRLLRAFGRQHLKLQLTVNIED